MINVAVLGAGAWGTALAKLLADKQHPTRIWSHRPDLVTQINEGHVNARYLPSAELPPNLVASADLEETLAWKNGRLLFRHAGMEAIMRQAARWYDVDVQFKDKVEEETYTASVPRNVPVSQLLQALQETSGLHFTIEGKKIIVTK